MSVITAIELVLDRLLHPLERVLRLGGVRVRLRAAHAARRARRRRATGARGRCARSSPTRRTSSRRCSSASRSPRWRSARSASPRSRRVLESRLRRRLDVACAATVSVVLAFVIDLDPARRDRRDRAEVVHASARRAGGAGRGAADRRVLLRLRLVHHVPRLARAARDADARHHADRRAGGLAQRGRAAHAAAPGRARRACSRPRSSR